MKNGLCGNSKKYKKTNNQREKTEKTEKKIFFLKEKKDKDKEKRTVKINWSFNFL